MPHSTINSQSTNLNIDWATFVQEQPVIVESPTQSHQNTPTPSNIWDEPNNDNISLQEQSSPSLAQAIMLMTEELHRRDSSPSKPTPTNSKAKEPDTFDDSDPKKLNNFILLCNLYFQNNSAYSKDKAKITFALTHLWGTALEFFEPMLTSDDALLWYGKTIGKNSSASSAHNLAQSTPQQMPKTISTTLRWRTISVFLSSLTV